MSDEKIGFSCHTCIAVVNFRDPGEKQLGFTKNVFPESSKNAQIWYIFLTAFH